MSLLIDNVESGYDRAPILHGVSMRVDPGELVAVVGSNGAGKTTLVRTISGLLAVRSGDVADDDGSLTKLTPAKRARRGTVMVPEGRKLFPQLTVGQNIEPREVAPAARTRSRPSSRPSPSSRSGGGSRPTCCRGASSRWWR